MLRVSVGKLQWYACNQSVEKRTTTDHSSWMGGIDLRLAGSPPPPGSVRREGCHKGNFFMTPATKRLLTFRPSPPPLKVVSPPLSIEEGKVS